MSTEQLVLVLYATSKLLILVSDSGPDNIFNRLGLKNRLAQIMWIAYVLYKILETFPLTIS